MNHRIARLNINQLEKSVRELALSAQQQVELYPDFVNVPYELADNFGNWCNWALVQSEVTLSDDQRIQLKRLDALLTRISGEQHANLWTEHALHSHSQWEEIRREANDTLRLFGWET